VAAALLVLLGTLACAPAQAPGATAPLERAAALGSESWSLPGTLAAGCAVAGAPQLVFPSAGPQLPTGTGAIVWRSDPGRCDGISAVAPRSAPSLVLAAVGAAEQPTITSTIALPGASGGQLAAVGASFGRVALAVTSPGPPATVNVLQGRATGPSGLPAFSQPGSLVALAHGYLGDVAVASLSGATIAVRVERHYHHAFGAARLVHLPRGPVTALAATMDYRSDVLLAWQQHSSIYAEMLRASGRTDPLQKVGPSGPDPQLQALVSDNDHGDLAWSSSEAAGATRTYLDRSASGVRFGAPRLLASFSDPGEVTRSPGSLALVRLSTENALLAWTELRQGRYVVRGSATALAAREPGATLSDPQAQAVLAGLAPGPHGEAIALWSSHAGSQSDPRATRTQLWAVRVSVAAHDRLLEQAPEMIAAPGALSGVSVAVDPANDRALAAWLGPQGGGSIEYAVSGGAKSVVAAAPRPGRPSAGAPSAGDGIPWLAIALAAAGAAGAIGLTRGALARRQRRPRGPRGQW
jgi:hypothetical protein